MSQKSVLGKGLASLIPSGAKSASAEQINAFKEEIKQTPPTVNAPSGAVSEPQKQTTVEQVENNVSAPSSNFNKDRHPGISLADPNDIELNPYQPRKEFHLEELKGLMDSISENGIIQPLLVRKTNSGYQLIAGERRLRASKMLGMKQVPIVIRRSTDKEALELAIVENIQREDLNCIEAALAYQQLMDEFLLNQEEVAKKVGKDRASIANHLRLLKLPQLIREDLKNARLSFGHGKVLLSLESELDMTRIRNLIIEKGLSVRETENLIQDVKNKKNQNTSLADAQNNLDDEELNIRNRFKNIAQELTRNWSTRIEVKGHAEKGVFSISYTTKDDFERILKALQEQKSWIK